jgi:hypothetical protein
MKIKILSLSFDEHNKVLDELAKQVVHIGNKLTKTDKYIFERERRRLENAADRAELLFFFSVDIHTSHGKDKDIAYAERVMKRIKALDNKGIWGLY